MDISHWRSQIDAIEDQLIALLSRRAEIAVEIGRCKRDLGLPIEDPAREKAILDRVEAKNPGPLAPGAMRTIFRTIIEETRRTEDKHSQGTSR